MSVSLYDLLDVPEDATDAEVRTAWKAAIADLDPTDRRFRAYNDAAGVLLDPAKRAAYDLELAAGRTEEPEEPEEPEDDTDPAPVAAEPAAAREPAAVAAKDEPSAASPQPAAVSTGPSTVTLLVAAFLAIVSIALTVVVLSWPGSLGDDSPQEQVEQAEEAESAAIVAEDAAAAAIPVVLGYDYRTLEEDFADAETYLTDDFAAKRTALFDQEAESGLTLREQVVEDQVVVVAAVVKTGLTRVSAEGDRATVVVYVNQDSQKGDEAPRSLQMWATLSMVAEGDAWLLDDICTETDCG